MAFKAHPRESLPKMADRYVKFAMPLLTARLMTTRGLALNLRRHIPVHIRRITMSAMARKDKKRTQNTEPLVDKDEVIAIAQEV